MCATKVPAAAIVFDPSAGSWHCLSCPDSFGGTATSLPAELLKVVRWLAHYPEQALRLAAADTESDLVARTIRSYAQGISEQPLGFAV